MRLGLLASAALSIAILGAAQLPSSALAARPKPPTAQPETTDEAPGELVEASLSSKQQDAGYKESDLDETENDRSSTALETSEKTSTEPALSDRPTPAATEGLQESTVSGRARKRNDLEASFKSTNPREDGGFYYVNDRRIWLKVSVKRARRATEYYDQPQAGLSKLRDFYGRTCVSTPAGLELHPMYPPILHLSAPLCTEINPQSLALDPHRNEVLFLDDDSTLVKLTADSTQMVPVAKLPKDAQADYEKNLVATLISALDAKPSERQRIIEAIRERLQRTPFCSIVRLLNKEGRKTGSLALGTHTLPTTIVRRIGEFISNTGGHRYRQLLLARLLNRIDLYLEVYG